MGKPRPIDPLRRLGFCGTCGMPIIERDKPAALGGPGEMWRVRECASLKGSYEHHDWQVVRRWNEGSDFDRTTGKARR